MSFPSSVRPRKSASEIELSGSFFLTRLIVMTTRHLGRIFYDFVCITKKIVMVTGDQAAACSSASLASRAKISWLTLICVDKHKNAE